MFAHRHAWDVTAKEAMAIQERLRAEVVLADKFGPVHLIGGIDVGFEQGGKVTRAAVAVLSFPELEQVDAAIARRPTSFPYVPGLLSFREVPAVLEALERLARLPDLLHCDGHGYAHPRRFGLASHLGVITDIATIGVAKTLLVGSYDEVGQHRGDRQWIYHRDEIVGAALRTRDRVNPVYVSSGHRVGLQSAIDSVMACGRGYRLPETTRWAHRLASGPSPAGR